MRPSSDDQQPGRTPPGSSALRVTGLEISFPASDGPVQVVDGVSLEIGVGESFGLIGETGAGKSLTAWAALDLVPSPGRVIGGTVEFDGQVVTGADDDVLRGIRGAGIGIVVQDPRAALNPMLTVHSQMSNALRAHRSMSSSEADSEIESALRKVGIADRKRILRAYPHQLSGGQAQRILIAMALTNRPRLLIGDEPTTGLDVTIQAEILDLLISLVRDEEHSLWLITHDLGIVANYTERAAVMFAGEVIEQAATGDLFGEPLHPYTAGLVASMAEAESEDTPGTRVTGAPPNLQRRPAGCQFAYRCPIREAACLERRPELRELRPGHLVRCFVAEREVGLSQAS